MNTQAQENSGEIRYSSEETTRKCFPDEAAALRASFGVSGAFTSLLLLSLPARHFLSQISCERTYVWIRVHTRECW